MVSVDLCSPTPDKPVEQFIDGTTRKVRKPDAEPCLLVVHVDEPGALIVEADGTELVTLPLTSGSQQFKLSDLIKREKPRRTIFAAFARQPDEIDTFSVCIRRGHPEGELLGTYNYQLLEGSEFVAQFNGYAKTVQTRYEPPVFTTDERSPQTAHNCPNCQCRVGGAHCDQCGYAADDEQ